MLDHTKSADQPEHVEDNHRDDENTGEDEQVAPGRAIVGGAARLPCRPSIVRCLVHNGCFEVFL